MPSALETLVKILKLEQDTGFKNTAVMGGLEAYLPNWVRDAHDEAKTPKQHALIEELGKVMADYPQQRGIHKRQKTVKYMLGRITSRVEPKPEYAVDLEKIKTEYPAEDKADEISTPPPPPKKKGRSSKRRYEDDVFDTFIEVEPAFKDIEISPESSERIAKPRRSPRGEFDLKEALYSIEILNSPVETLKGVGAKRAEQLANLGITTLNDLLFHFPRRYDDYTRMEPLHRLPFGKPVTAIGVISHFSEHYSRNNRTYIRVILEDGGGKLQLTFFNQSYLKNVFRKGMQIAVAGTVERFQGQPSMTNPEWETIDKFGLQRGSIVPVYPLTKGLTSKAMRKLVKQVIDEWAIKIPDYVPSSVLDRTEMVDLGWAIQQTHFPKNWDYIEYANERLAFDELLLLQLGILTQRADWQSVAGIPLDIDNEWLIEFQNNLPYQFTNAQQNAIEAIFKDMRQDIPMNRLLQGDVGAGKTVVAAVTMGVAVKNGKQAAIMAPTSILAEQHYQSMCDLLKRFPDNDDIQIRLLTGGTSESERRDIYAGLENGTIHVIVGTHALIQERVVFNELAIAVIDEQHRFGVEERGALRGKGTNPHVLVMTATPIPRTLALTMYADLDLTVLDELPAGRTPIQTRLLYEGERERAYSFIRSQLEQGRQGFIIYPLVESSDRLDAASAVEAYEDLQATAFPDYRLGLLHGRLTPREKDDIMQAFSNGEIDLLISTTVIEVGIDVPNATTIMIENAERFGLAQLHQLRGRVGRGEHQSSCILMSNPENEEAIERLQALEQTTDGFELAELDWKLRGPGDLLGTRQAGFSAIKMDTAMDVRLVELAQHESKALFAEDPTLNLPEHTLLAKRLEQLQLQQQKTDIS